MRLVIALCTLCWLAGSAHADRAEQLFRKGKKLLAEKRYAEACIAFEDSDRLDPGIGAKLNVAKCYQDWGKLATAWRWYREAEDMATKAGDERAKRIHERIEELDASVPRLTLRLPADTSTDGLVVKLDGVALDQGTLGAERRLDPGSHQIETILNGATETKVIPLERGGSAEITLDLPSPAKPANTPRAELASDAPRRDLRRIGMLTAGGGGFVIVIASVATLRARDDYNYALDNHCQGATNMCDDKGLDTTHRARRRANIATVATIGGLAAVAGGAYLYFTSWRASRGERALYLAPQVGGDGTGVVLGGAF
jgi:hypothetical protein